MGWVKYIKLQQASVYIVSISKRASEQYIALSSIGKVLVGIG